MPIDLDAMQALLAEQAAHLRAAKAAGARPDLASLRAAFNLLHPTSREVVAWAWWGCAPEAVDAKDFFELAADLCLDRGGVARAARALGIAHQSATERMVRAKVEIGGLVAALATFEAEAQAG